MTLKELFDSMEIRKCVAICLVERGVEYQTDESYEQLTVRDCDGSLPTLFQPYADNKVKEIYPAHDYFAKETPDADGKTRAEHVESLHIKVYAEPSADICTVFYTGGGIWCGIVRTADGWFMGETNSWGGIWKTYSQALESYDTEDCGFVRYVSDTDELKSIWTRIYTEIIAECGYQADECRDWLNTLDDDLASL